MSLADDLLPMFLEVLKKDIGGPPKEAVNRLRMILETLESTGHLIDPDQATKQSLALKEANRQIDQLKEQLQHFAR